MKRLAAIVFCFLTVLGCKKDKRPLPAGVLPSADSYSTAAYTDLPVTGYTRGFQAVNTFNSKGKFLGSHLDVQFGVVSAGIVLNTNFSQEGLSFQNDTATSGEFVFVIDADNSLGDIHSPLTYSVYEIAADLDIDSVYRTTDYPPKGAPVVAGVSRSLEVREGKNVISIPVDKSYIQSVMNNTSALTSITAYHSRYKGYYVVASANGNGAILKTDLFDAASGFYMYYKGTSTYTFQFSFSGDQAINYNPVFATPLAGTAFDKQSKGDTTGGATDLFLQDMGIASAKIYLPFLKQYGDTFNVAVNRAEVVFYVDQPLMSGYNPPSSLVLLPIAISGNDTIAYDQNNRTDNARYNGYYDVDRNAYVFDISNHVQAIFRGRTVNRGFHLYIGDPGVLNASRRDLSIQRVVLAGNGRSDLRPRLNLSLVRLR